LHGQLYSLDRSPPRCTGHSRFQRASNTSTRLVPVNFNKVEWRPDLPLRDQHLIISIIEHAAQAPLRAIRARLQPRTLNLLSSTPRASSLISGCTSIGRGPYALEDRLEARRCSLKFAAMICIARRVSHLNSPLVHGYTRRRQRCDLG
jgi:hypothetical protein